MGCIASRAPPGASTAGQYAARDEPSAEGAMREAAGALKDGLLAFANFAKDGGEAVPYLGAAIRVLQGCYDMYRTDQDLQQEVERVSRVLVPMKVFSSFATDACQSACACGILITCH